MVATHVLKHSMSQILSVTHILKHSLSSSLSVLHILKHNIGQSYLITMARKLKMNDTSKSIKFNTDNNETKSEGN